MNKLLIFSLLIAIASCDNKKDADFEVDGTIKNATVNTIYLEETPLGNMQPEIIDSATLDKNGKFKLKAIAKEESIYNLRLGESEYPFVSFINDADEITVEADVNAPELYTVKGSPASQLMQEYLMESSNRLRSIYRAGMAVDSLTQVGGSDSLISVKQQEQAAATAALKTYTTNLFQKSKSPALSLYILGSYQSLASNPTFGIEGYQQEEVVKIVSETAQKFPDHAALATINKSVQAPPQQSAEGGSSWVNKQAPDFTLPDVNGQPVSLSSFKGKYLLVDFWASWCPPCRAENPNLVKAYNQFKGKNFAILGVSLDRPGQKENWLQAIKDDHLSWTHVSDLKFWNSEVVGLYQFEGIPFNVLINPEGVVVAENLRGEELVQKLSEVL